MSSVEPTVMNTIPTHGGVTTCAPGMDHGWYAYSRIDRRPVRAGLPSLTVCPIIDLTAVEWERPAVPAPVRPPGGRGLDPYPDIPRMSHHEYGHRVGIFRLLDVLEAAGMHFAVVVDALTVTHYPRLLEHVIPRSSEVIAGGLSGTRAITSSMSSEEEVDYVGMTLEILEENLGERPAGWVSPVLSNSFRTPWVLADAGIVYTADWSNDEQPYPFTGAADGLWSFPMSWELSDVNNIIEKGRPDHAYAAALTEAADVLRAHGPESPRVLGIHLHPWVSGHMYMADLIESSLTAICNMDGVVVSTPSPVLAAFR
jgi:peptidoglycan/xylan/chitin deacetylase (PgdA/CDA1 family)